MSLKNYPVEVNGIQTVLKLTEAEAVARGLVKTTKATGAGQTAGEKKAANVSKVAAKKAAAKKAT